MNTLTVDQILTANKNAVVEAQALAATAFVGFEKLMALNLATAKSALFESTDFSSVFGAKSPTDALAAQAALVKPLAEKSIAYGRSVYAIASETNAELATAAESRLLEVQKSATDALETMAKNAPAGTESMVAVVKSAVLASQNAMETAKSSAKKAMEVAEQQANDMTDNVLGAVKTPSRSKK